MRTSGRSRAAATAVAVLAAVAAAALVSCRPDEQPDDGFHLLETAYEIVDGGTIVQDPQVPLATYKNAEDPDNPGHEMTADAWPDYQPPRPYLKNTTRNLQFNESQFIASPGEPDGVTAYVETSDGYTWAAMSAAVSAMWPYDPADYSGLAARGAYYAGSLVVTPPLGVVKVTANFKAQRMKFWANEGGVPADDPEAVPLDRYLVTDAWGNVYLMHASGQEDAAAVAAAFADAVLPAGWSKRTVQLDEDLVLDPAQGADGTYHYLVLRDSADNTYHQLEWGAAGVSVAAQVPGLPIWGGQTDDRLRGDVGEARDDLLHGAGGDDVLEPGAGNDEVWGDAGDDTVILPGRRGDYAITERSEDLTRVVLSAADGTKVLQHVETVRFEDESVIIEALARR